MLKALVLGLSATSSMILIGVGGAVLGATLMNAKKERDMRIMAENHSDNIRDLNGRMDRLGKEVSEVEDTLTKPKHN